MPNENEMFLKKMNNILFAMLGSDNLVTKWWDTPNKAFHHKTPNMMMAENYRVVQKYIYGQAFR